MVEFFRVEGTGESGTVSDSASISRDLSQYAGDLVAFRLISENQSEITLESIRISYDTDGDGLTDNVEEHGIRTGVDTVHTSPTDADTDGDGLSDGEEVVGRDGGAYGGYFHLKSDPTKADSDGDGVGDYEETRDDYQIRYTDDSADTSGFLAALRGDDDPGKYLRAHAAESDPLAADTDHDGLDDRDERILGTDAGRVDTDGDGLLDGRERQVGEDPTLFDATPPRINGEVSYWTTLTPPESHYGVIYGVFDASGVTRVAIYKDDDRYVYRELSPPDPATGEYVTFDVGFIETSLDALQRTTVDIRGEDRHGNAQRKTVYKRANFYGNVAKEYGGGIENPGSHTTSGCCPGSRAASGRR
ncbi:hypothetical protein ACFQH6_18730 [Halobacteriaceae archaeon GCM10025711]